MENLTEIRDQIRLWSEREDLPDDTIDHFIRLTEREFKEEILLPDNEKSVQLTVDSLGQVSLPSDHVKTRYLWVTDTDGLPKTVHMKKDTFISRMSSLFSPVGMSYFERVGSNYQFSPAAALNDIINMNYYHVIDSLLDLDAAIPNSTNFVVDVMPTVYLFGALAHLHMYTYNEERALYYKELYENAKQDLLQSRMEVDTLAENQMQPSSVKPRGEDRKANN